MAPNQIFIEEAAKVVASLFVNVVWMVGEKVLGKVDEQIKMLLLRASQEYIQSYTNRHGQLKVLGMREPVPLENVYTNARLVNEQAAYKFTSIQTLKENYRERNERRFEPSDLGQSGLEVANEHQHLMVLGGPGAGKSTFLRRIGLEAFKGIRGGYKPKCIPVFLDLKNFLNAQIDIERLILEEFIVCNFPLVETIIPTALQQGRFLILFDGLDEVPPDNLDTVITKIENFVDQYDKNRFIASCRMAAYKRSFRRFTDVVMADFNDLQIEKFIKQWFRSEKDQQAGTAQKCWEILQKRKNAAAKELAHTPLLLTFLCLVYDRSQTFPDNRSTLYRKALRILLEEWAAEKRIMRDQIYRGISIELEELLLSEIACRGLHDDNLFFHERDLIEQIKQFLENNLNAPERLAGEEILEAIAIQQGILVKRAEDTYSFSHLTLQEYLTAQYIDDHRRIQPLVTEHLTNERWREVFLLVSGLIRSGSDELLNLMLEQAKLCVNSPTLQILFNWAERWTSDSEDISTSVAKRATAISLYCAVVRTYKLSLALIRVYARTLIEARVHETRRTLHVARENDRALSHELSFVSVISTSSSQFLIEVLEAARSPDLNFLSARIRNQALELPTIFFPCVISLANKLKGTEIFKDELDFIHMISQIEMTQESSEWRSTNGKVLNSKECADYILQMWFDTLKLDTASFKLSNEEEQNLQKYFYVCELIVRCKQAAVQVSPKTWTSIQDRMFRANLNQSW